MSWITAVVEWLLSLLTGNKDPRNEKVVTIQATAFQACGFLPMYDSVLQLLTAAFPPAVAVSVVAKAICKAVNEQEMQPALQLASLGGPVAAVQTVVVNGIVVQGRKVR